MLPEITLLTVPKYGKGGGIMRLKEFAKKVLKRRRGPDQVINSLIRGLDELGVRHNLNPNLADFAPIVHVPIFPEVLQQAIDLKRRGLIRTLIAGPSIVITPIEADGILSSPEIDRIVLPSEWVKNLYLSLTPSLAGKIEVWPSGVRTPHLPQHRTDISTCDGKDALKSHCILYSKNAPEDLQNHIKETLRKKSIDCTVFIYGSFRQESYFQALEKSNFAIFLSPTESQGLALQEAWIRNVPTLVWNKKVWKHGDIIWHDDKISAPYLTDASGTFFSDATDFDTKIAAFAKNAKNGQFAPRQYALEHLTDKKSAEHLMEIARSAHASHPGHEAKSETVSETQNNPGHKKYFDYLDALRCGAFLLVFYAHTGSIFKGAEVTQAFPLSMWQKFTVYGSYGVNFFFVLSGFLITYLLLKEKAASPTKTISIRSFYRKRVLRIWPVYFTTLFFGAFVLPFLISSATYSIFTLADPRMSATTFFYNFFFSGNFYQGLGIAMAPLSIGILWSVAIEEQFYLIWPWIVKWFNLRTLAFVTSLLIALSLLYKFLWADDRMANYYLPWSLAMDLGFGALLGISYYANRTRRIITSSIFIITSSMALTAAVILINGAQAIDILRLTKTPIIDCIFVLIILFFINRTKALADSAKYGSRHHPVYVMKKIRDRAYASLTHLGKISYGLYAYHTICLMLAVSLLHAAGILNRDVGLSEFFLTISLGFILTIIVAELSYLFMEKKFLARKPHDTQSHIRTKSEKRL